MPLRVVAIVEGHGENGATRSLLERWVKKYLPRKYKETVDQARFVGHMDLNECEAASRSFRKLVKELRVRLPAS